MARRRVISICIFKWDVFKAADVITATIVHNYVNFTYCTNSNKRVAFVCNYYGR